MVLAEWYGAKGDGATLDGSAIQTALNSSQGVNLLARNYYIGPMPDQAGRFQYRQVVIGRRGTRAYIHYCNAN